MIVWNQIMEWSNWAYLTQEQLTERTLGSFTGAGGMSTFNEWLIASVWCYVFGVLLIVKGLKELRQ